MFDRDLWREIFQSINMNRTRSLLSGFTIAFAILLFAILFGIANGLGNTFDEGFKDDANNSIFIKSDITSKPYKGLQAGRKIQFTNADFDFVKSKYKSKIQYITPRFTSLEYASFKGKANTYTTRSIHPDNQFIEQNTIKSGRYINQLDLKNKSRIAVIGTLVEQDLFLNTEAIGKYINLAGIPFKVVGVFEDEGGDSEERIIYVPLTTSQALYGATDEIDGIYLTYIPELNYDEAIDFGDDILKQFQKRFYVDEEDQRAIEIRNRAESTKNVTQMSKGLDWIIIIIGFGTLIAGIVGISNIMIFIVKERTKEIGIRKALGASPKSIISIILVESVLITVIAGFVGLLAGVTFLELVGPSLEKYFIKDPNVKPSIVIGATITLIIAGTIAGYLPAKKASQIKPITALRDD